MHVLSLATNKSQSTLSVRQKLSKISYDNYKKSVNIITRFNSKKSFFDLLIFTNKKDLIIK